MGRADRKWKFPRKDLKSPMVIDQDSPIQGTPVTWTFTSVVCLRASSDIHHIITNVTVYLKLETRTTFYLHFKGQSLFSGVVSYAAAFSIQ